MVDPVPESKTPELSEIRTTRLEAFSDGVLAIIVTTSWSWRFGRPRNRRGPVCVH